MLRAVPPGEGKRASIDWGEHVAQTLLADRAKDGAQATVIYASRNPVGVWRPTEPAFAKPALPQRPGLKPFAMTSAAQFRPAMPPALTSAAYADDFNQTKQLGAKPAPSTTAQGALAAAISATVNSSSTKTVIVQNTRTFGNVGALTTADSTGTFTLRHDRTVPFDPTKLTWTIKQPFIVSAATPTAGASEVGVTVRPQVFFSKPVDPATLNASNFFAKGPDGQKLPATIVPANDATFAWLFFTAPMPGASQAIRQAPRP